MHKNKKKIELFKRFISNIVKDRNSRILIQNDAIFTIKDLHAIFKAMNKAFKTKKFKKKQRRLKTFNVIKFIFEIHFSTFLQSKKIQLKKIKSK